MEGQESYQSDPSQGTLQKDLDYGNIPMYATIEGISTYVRGYRGKSAYIIVYIVLGMINDTSKDKMWSIGSNESAAGQGKAIHV